jgi:two-component system NtrC family response regulator
MVITDYRLSDKTGFDILEEVRKQNPNIPIVIMTAYGSIDDAVKIMKSGAYDYLQNPIELSELLHIIEKCYERSHLISENILLRQQLESHYKFSSIISQSDEMEAVLNMAGRVANSKASVLICGESGTGKELIAKAIHYSSPRKNKPFVVVNCAAMPETLFESELFGHEKGAFTGAEKMRIGKFEQADGSTLFIDEVGDIPLLIQVKLLRAIQFGEIQRVGSNKTMQLDVRIIAATNRNLNKMIEDNEFREDLFYRLNVVAIQIPPLRSRKLDIQPLVEHFIEKYAALKKKEVFSITKEALNLLTKYDFPGNIRELENIIQRAIVLTVIIIFRLTIYQI